MVQVVQTFCIQAPYAGILQLCHQDLESISPSWPLGCLMTRYGKWNVEEVMLWRLPPGLRGLDPFHLFSQNLGQPAAKSLVAQSHQQANERT